MTTLNADKVDRLAQVLVDKGFDRTCDAYHERWEPLDVEIRHVCEDRCKGHGSLAVTLPKVLIVDGAYNGGLSRCLNAKGDPHFSAPVAVARWMCTPDGARITDEAIAGVSLAKTPDMMAFLRSCLLGHGSLVHELRSLGDSGKLPRSFVSKYLHFHNRDYIIYDRDTDAVLSKLLAGVGGLRKADCVFGPTDPGTSDDTYCDYLRRFRYLAAAGRSIRPNVTIKELDNFLWTGWGWRRTRDAPIVTG
jgi:hypothetical protein